MLPWVIAAMVVLIIAVVAGYSAAFFVADLQRARVPPGALLPTPTPTQLLTPAGGSPAAATPTASGPVLATRPPVATLPPQTPAGTPLVHVVRRGESLSLIAEQYGVDPQAIIDLNELENPNLIVPGQELLIPPPTGP